MDTAGAAILRVRLEQQQHWLQASGVDDGRVPRSDPDAACLLEIQDDERFYESEDGRFRKQLVDGTWVRTDIAP